jgi:hypothetical protein
MRTGLVAASLVAASACLVTAPVDAKDPDPVRIRFVAPAEGCDAVIAEEAGFGLRVGIEKGRPGETELPFPVALDEAPLPAPGKAVGAALKKWKKDTALLVAWLPDGRVAEWEQEAAKAKVPLLVVSREPTTPSIDPKRAVFWAGGAPEQDEALQAMDYALQPLGMRRPQIVTGDAFGARVASHCEFFHHRSQSLVPPVGIDDFTAASYAGKTSEDARDGIVYLGGADGAERLLAALAAAGSELPVLLSTGTASAAVPTFHEGKGTNAWAMEPSWFEDRSRLGKEDRYALQDAAKAVNRRVLPAMVRGQRVGMWVRAALAAAGGGDAKTLVSALRALDRPGAAGKPVFEPYGHVALARFVLWRSEAIEVEEKPVCHERPETRVPVQGVPHVGFFSARKYRWEPGTFHVWIRFVGGEERTIEKDLDAIGLHTDGYEEDLEDRILDDLWGRVLSKVNRLFLRNPDGTAIPGVSYNISFSAYRPGDDVKGGRKWDVLIGGDDPVAGGRASGNLARVFSTFIQRTMYVQHKLDPALSNADRPHMAGGYVWDTSADENIRNGMVRSLVDGFSQALALTTAHELGHLAGCGHDTTIPRSIMNVQEGAGLEFDWAEWAPEHEKILNKRLRRAPVPKR